MSGLLACLSLESKANWDEELLEMSIEGKEILEILIESTVQSKQTDRQTDFVLPISPYQQSYLDLTPSPKPLTPYHVNGQRWEEIKP